MMESNYSRGLFEIVDNKPLTSDVFKMVLRGDTKSITSPGQFVNLLLCGKYLRRPISVCDVEGDLLTLVYKVVGGGTGQMSEMAAGEKLDILSGLGNGFLLDAQTEKPLLVGGGVGVPPLYYLAKKLISKGLKPQILLGFNTSSEVFMEEEFRALNVEVTITTADGSQGIKGFVTDALAELDFDYIYTCGPLPMLRALSDATLCSGEYSFEERMGCGFGACVGCTCKTQNGYKRICKEGPVLKKEEILWE